MTPESSALATFGDNNYVKIRSRSSENTAALESDTQSRAHRERELMQKRDAAAVPTIITFLRPLGIIAVSVISQTAGQCVVVFLVNAVYIFPHRQPRVLDMGNVCSKPCTTCEEEIISNVNLWDARMRFTHSSLKIHFARVMCARAYAI